MVIPIDAVHYSAGYDSAYRWHEAKASFIPAEPRANDPLASARGAIYGLLIGGALWVGLILAVRVVFNLISGS